MKLFYENYFHCSKSNVAIVLISLKYKDFSLNNCSPNLTKTLIDTNHLFFKLSKLKIINR